MTFNRQMTLIVPLRPNVPGMSVTDYNGNLALLELELIDDFGGFTAVDGRGAWRPSAVNGDVLYEPVRIFTLACAIGLTSDGIAALRHRVKVLLDQRAVYLAAYDLAEKPVQ